MLTTWPVDAPIELHCENGWLTIWLNRPDVRNALSTGMTDALLVALTEVQKDCTIRGVTLRGRGNIFCAGGDLKEFKSMATSGQTVMTAAAASRRAGDLFHAIHTLPQVVVVLIEGAAMAGGLGMACAADIVAGTRHAKFALTETMIGIPPAQIAPYVVRRVGPIAARRMMLTGMRVNGADAHALGMLDFLCEDAAELAVVEAKLRQSVMHCAPGANAATKEILSATEYMKPDELIKFASTSFAKCLLSEEGREGIASFLEKRKPEWANDLKAEIGLVDNTRL